MQKMIQRSVAMLIIVVMSLMTATAYTLPQEEPVSVPRDSSSTQTSAQTESESMEIALVSAKKLLDIDDERYTEFSYSSSYSNYETKEGLIWYFNWSDSDYNYIYATVAEDGMLRQYGKSYDYSNSFGFAEITKNSAIEISDEFIKRAIPESYSYFKEPVNLYVDIHDRLYRIVYNADVNGYYFSTAQVSVSVDKYTGEIASYSVTNANPNRFRFEDARRISNVSDAVAAYVEKIGLSLEYKSYFNYEDSTINVFPVYLFNSFNDRYISAVTGNVVHYVYDRGLDGNIAGVDEAEMYDLATSSRGRGTLTPAEIEAIEKLSNFLTREQALQILLDAADLAAIDIDSFDDRYTSLNRDYYNKDRYIYEVSLYRYHSNGDLTKEEDIRSFYGRVDAQSGKVYSFSFDYVGMMSSERNYTLNQAQSAVDDFLTAIAPEEYEKSRRSENDGDYDFYPNWSNDFRFEFLRYENEIPFKDNGISVTFNAITGKISAFYLNWYENISFPSLNNVLAPLAAMSEFVEQNGSEVCYITSGSANASLVYDFGYGAYIDPFSGKMLDYNGELSTIEDIVPDYSDVAGHWSEAVVNRLLDNGVYLWGGSFEPNKVMTENEFLQYLLLLETSYRYPEPVLYFEQRGIDIDIDSNRNLNRQEAARIIADYLGYRKIAEQPEYFVYPFSDSVDDSYKGYITICYMLGILGGDSGNFNAQGNITRGQAATILQNLIVFKSN